MTRTIRPVAALAVLVAAAPAFAQQYAGWHSNLDRAAEAAAKSGKPIFAVFRCER